MSKSKGNGSRWHMPDWMKPYAQLVTNTGDSDPDRVAVVEAMYNGEADPRVNLPLSTLQACVKSQVGLLYVLNQRGVLLTARQAYSVLGYERQRDVLTTLANSCRIVLATRAFPKRLRPGMKAIADEAEAALE